MTVKVERRKTKKSRIGMHIVGPAARSNELDGLDEGKREEYGRWETARESLVSISKKWGMKDSLVESERAKTQKRRATVKAARAKLAKGGKTLTAPSGPESDTDLEGRIYDFVDDLVEVPYPLEVLATLLENSSSLRPNIDAMETNIDGFGHRFEGVLDFSHPEIADHIRDLMLAEAIDKDNLSLEDLTEETLDRYTPTPEDVAKRQKLWERVATVEQFRITSYFEFLSPLQSSFTQLRRLTRHALELIGNAGWEIIRDDPEDVESKIRQTHFVPFINVRLLRAEKKTVTVNVVNRKDTVSFETVPVQRTFRRFVRVLPNTRIYYKEVGDPRTISRTTGRIYKDVEKLREVEGDRAQPANEFKHWKIPSLISPYGVARWVGTLISVLGSRASEEVNFLYFDHKAIPPMVVLVSGGNLTPESVERLEKHIEEQVKGRKNFHRILLLEGLPAGADVSEGDMETSGKVRIELRPLTKELSQDALFQTYESNNTLKIGRAFRQPPLLTGDQRDANRSTADVVKSLVEEQVYQPARDEFDATMDRLLMVNQRIRFWRFKTNAPVQRIPNDLVANVTKCLEQGAITPNEARLILSDAFSKDFKHRPEKWADLPPKIAAILAQAQVQAASLGSAGGTGLDSQTDQAAEEAFAPDPGTDVTAETKAQITKAKEKFKRALARQKAHSALGWFRDLRKIVEQEVQVAADSFSKPEVWSLAQDPDGSPE